MNSVSTTQEWYNVQHINDRGVIQRTTYQQHRSGIKTVQHINNTGCADKERSIRNSLRQLSLSKHLVALLACVGNTLFMAYMLLFINNQMLLFMNNQMCFKGRGNNCSVNSLLKCFVAAVAYLRACANCAMMVMFINDLHYDQQYVHHYDHHKHQQLTLSQRLMVAAAARCLRTSLLHKNSFFGSWGPLETIFMYLPRVPNYMTVGEKFWDAAKWFPLFKWSKKCSVFEVCSVNMFLLLLHKISKSSKLCPNSILQESLQSLAPSICFVQNIFSGKWQD